MYSFLKAFLVLMKLLSLSQFYAPIFKFKNNNKKLRLLNSFQIFNQQNAARDPQLPLDTPLVLRMLNICAVEQTMLRDSRHGFQYA